MRSETRARSGRHSPLRRTGRARVCRQTRERMVHATFAGPASRLIGARFRKMSGQYFSDFLDRLDHGVTEFLVAKMRAHPIDKALPEFFAAFFVNGLIANDCKLVRARGDEDQHGVPLARLVHSHSVELFLRRNQRIRIYLSVLNINENLTGLSSFLLSY